MKYSASFMIFEAGVTLVALSAHETESVVNVAQKFDLDFDNAYQYAVAERYGLTIVSFDSDFDRTEKERMVPKKLLSEGPGTGKGEVRP